MTKKNSAEAPVTVSAKRKPPAKHPLLVGLKEKTSKQPFLFGEVDEVYNALETERTYLVEEIKDCFKTIDRKKTVIRLLEERKSKLDGALKAVKKQRAALEPEKKK